MVIWPMGSMAIWLSSLWMIWPYGHMAYGLYDIIAYCLIGALGYEFRFFVGFRV